MRANRSDSASSGKLLPGFDHIQPQVQSLANSPVAEAQILRESVQSHSRAPEIPGDPPQSRGPNRKLGPEEQEADHRRERPWPATDSTAVTAKPLTKKNLKQLDRLNRRENSEVPNDTFTRKRSQSRTSITDPSEHDIMTFTRTTNKSSLSLADYRLITLAYRNIVVEHGDVPESLRMRLDSIFLSHISEDDKQEVTAFAKSICCDIIDVLGRASYEDDHVDMIVRALHSMNEKLLGGAFAMCKKAGKVLKQHCSYR